jgi:FtsZ-binding cell division protein ZapB
MNHSPHKQAIYLNPCRNSSFSYDSSSNSFDPRPDPIRSFPKSPKNPEKTLEIMIKHFKIHKSIPNYLISELPLDSCLLMVESLIREKIMLQDELSMKIEESVSENEILAIRAKNNASPLLKIQEFRALENVSPIEKDDSDGHTNYNIVSLPLTPRDEIVTNQLTTKSNTFEDYKREVLKLSSELKEVFSYNQLLQYILSLSKNNESIQLNEIVKKKISAYNLISNTVSEELKRVKKALEPNEGFVENMNLLRPEIKILSEMIEFDKKCDLKPSEMQTVNQLIDLNIEDPKRLEKRIDELLAGHDIAEISFMLVKYIKFLEEQTTVNLKAEALNCLLTELRNELSIEEAVSEGLRLDMEIEELKRNAERVKFERSKVERAQQVKIRTKKAKEEKKKWTLPEEMTGLSGVEIYSETLKKLKNGKKK